VEVRECFSLLEILEVKAPCELARYGGAAPSPLQCPFGFAGFVLEVVMLIVYYTCKRRGFPCEKCVFLLFTVI
jgi:hypothetical protein